MRARINEYWLVDVNEERVDVFRSPADEACAETRHAGRGESISPLAFADVVIAVDELFV